MKRWQLAVVTTGTVAAFATGGMWYFQPHTMQEIDQHRHQQQVEQLGDHQQNLNEEHGGAPGREHRPPVKIRLK